MPATNIREGFSAIVTPTRRDKQLTKLCNMGGCCHTYGFYPVGINRNSKNCDYKKEGHHNDATYNNRLEGNIYWPVALRISQSNSRITWHGRTN